METFDGFPVKGGYSGPDWELENCAAVAKQHKATFEVPSPSEEALVKIGALLRLHFIVTDPTIASQKESPRAERMWVEVCALSNKGVLRGHLTNKPVYIPSLTPGDVIEFKWLHVAQVYVTKDDARHESKRT